MMGALNDAAWVKRFLLRQGRSLLPHYSIKVNRSVRLGLGRGGFTATVRPFPLASIRLASGRRATSQVRIPGIGALRLKPMGPVVAGPRSVKAVLARRQEQNWTHCAGRMSVLLPACPSLDVRISDRARVSQGWYDPHRGVIFLSGEHLRRLGDASMKRVLAHLVAHAALYELTGERVHNGAFREMAKRLGGAQTLAGNRCVIAKAA